MKYLQKKPLPWSPKGTIWKEWALHTKTYYHPENGHNVHLWSKNVEEHPDWFEKVEECEYGCTDEMIFAKCKAHCKEKPECGHDGDGTGGCYWCWRKENPAEKTLEERLEKVERYIADEILLKS